MYDEDSAVARWVRWIARLTMAAVVLLAVAVWYYLKPRPPGSTTKSAQQNVAILRDHSLRESQRRLAGDGLSHADASIIADLIAELKRGDALGRELAATALGRLELRASAAVEPLIAALDDPEPLVRERAVAALGQVTAHPQAAVDAVRKSVHDADSKVRDKAFEVLRRQEAVGIRVLADLLNDIDADVRRRAVIELGRMGSEADSTREALRAVKDDRDPLVRAEALAALVKPWALGPEDLAQAINDPDLLVRNTALSLLGRMGRRAAPIVPVLVARLQEAFDAGDLNMAAELALTVGRIGPAARSATEVLLEHVDSPDPLDAWVRMALKGIGLEAEFDLPELLERAEAGGDEVKSLNLWTDRLRRSTDPQAPTPAPYQISDADMAHLSGLKNLELLNLNDASIGDAGLAHLAALTHLKTLSLWRTKVTSAGLAHLANMPQLRSLFLADCAITDDGLRHLSKLAGLESVSLRGTQVTDAGMRELLGLTRLRKLELGGTTVTDAGLAQLVELPALERLDSSKGQFTLTQISQFKHLTELDLHDEPITDDDLALVARLTHLRELRITRTQVPRSGVPSQEILRSAADQDARAEITDAGLAHLETLKELRTLVITDAQITDAGLKHLAALTKLRSLWLERCATTAHGIAALKQLLPGLQVNVPLGRQPFATEYKVVGLEGSRPSN